MNNHLNILGQPISIGRKVTCQYVITPTLNDFWHIVHTYGDILTL